MQQTRSLLSCLRFVLLIVAAPATAIPAFGGNDHHMHIHSTNGAAAWAALCAAAEDPCGADEQPPGSALGAADAIRALDEAGLTKGAVLSLAYFYGAPELSGSRFDDPALVRAENEYVALEVARFPDRLVGFFSVNPLSDYAIGEVSYWAGRGGLVGLKLHLANSRVDLRDPEHQAKLAAVIGVMNDHAMPVVIHLRDRDAGYGYEAAALFIDRVAGPMPAVTIQLAHVAGWGGYDTATDEAMRAFLDAFDKGVLDRTRVWFDLAAVVTPDMPDTVCAGLGQRLREIGLDRLLFGSDWDEADPDDYLAALGQCLQFGDPELRVLVGNGAPYLR